MREGVSSSLDAARRGCGCPLPKQRAQPSIVARHISLEQTRAATFANSCSAVETLQASTQAGISSARVPSDLSPNYACMHES
jgi:hypothetical protein